MNISQLLEALKDTQVNLSIGEKLVAGLSVAILSMSVVFIVLVVIALIINLLQREKKVVETNDIENKISYEPESVVEESEDMGALVSVITAAICATTGKSSNNIIVRKIVRSNNSKSSWESTSKN